jgi:uncharacterized phage protein (TIGR01671 family)
MREIKFRVWIPFAFSDNATELGEYISLDLAWREDFIEFEPDGNTLRPTGNDEGYFIEQFTGCYDSEGKEIYEGDIVKDARDYRGKYIISYADGSFYESLIVNNKAKIRLNLSEYDAAKSVAIIGNIHDNPELMQGVHNA